MVKVSLADKLLVKLQKLGLNKRKATDLAKKLAPSAARQPVRGTVTGKLTDKLYALGLSKKRAAELAKGLAPTVRASIKAKAKKAKLKLDDVDDAMVNQTVAEVADDALRLDLPVVARSAWQRTQTIGIELMRVMDGLTTNATYIAAAVKGDVGIIAIRQLGSDYFNVKFYPRMSYWGWTQERCEKLGATDFLKREWYERMHFRQDGVDKLLKDIRKEQRPRITRLAARLMGVTSKVLFKAFTVLYQRADVA